MSRRYRKLLTVQRNNQLAPGCGVRGTRRTPGRSTRNRHHAHSAQCRFLVLSTRRNPWSWASGAVPHNPTMEFHFLANSVRSSEVMSRAMASRLRMASSGKISGSSASAAVSSSLEEASTSRAAGTGHT